MRQRILCLLDERRTHLKREWERRLRLEPVRSALGEPAVLVYMMDETLRQLAGLLARRHVPRVAMAGDFEDRCRCRLNPLIGYFAAGEAALLTILEEGEAAEEPMRALIAGSWRVLAQGEVDAVCGMCVRACHTPYPKIPATLRRLEPVDAGGRDIP